MDDFDEFQDQWNAANAAARDAEAGAGEALRIFRCAPSASNLGRLTDALAARGHARGRVRSLMVEFFGSQQAGSFDMRQSGAAGAFAA